jgi:hypothetical protein
VECSERGLKLTSPGFRAKDEGFESDCESVRSVRITEAVGLDLSDLIGHLEIAAKDEKETESGTGLHPSSAPSSPGGSMDSTSLTSSSGLHHVSSDDNNSSSGNGSDSDEFGASAGERSPYWETLPNLSSFQSYPIEDVVFCHCDSFHPSTLVWVVRHLDKMIALVTAFRTRSEAEELFHTYRELRVKLKPVKYKINPILGLKLANIPATTTTPLSSAPSPPSSSDESADNFASLPTVYPTAILQETHQSTSTLFNYEPKSLGFEFDSNLFRGHENISGTSSLLLREPLCRTGSNSLSLHNHVYVSNPNIVRFGQEGNFDGNNGDESNSSSEDNAGDTEEINQSNHPQRPQRKVFTGIPVLSTGKGTIKSCSAPTKPVLLVPLKTESVSAPKSTYPKESYLYHVMGRSSSTFAPYQRSLNFLPHQQYANNGGGGDYMAWGNGGQHLLVPFSSWLELSEMSKVPNNTGTGRKSSPYGKSRTSSRINGRISSGAKGTTSKILLRDAGRDSSMWASLSQRFKKNMRENLIPKLNGIWTQNGENGRKKRTNKKVTFNAWATVQMV